MQIKNGYALIIFISFMLGCTGCVGNRTGRIDQQRIESTRKDHAKTEIEYKAENFAHPTEPGEQNPGLPPGKPLTLDDAVSYALTYNLDAEVKKLESDILKESMAGARLKMLPSLVFDGEISRRNNYDASFSDPLFASGEQDYNYSRDKSTKRYNVELSWDILNFGIAYYQQRQAAEQYKIAEQRRRRVVQNLRFDITKTYWQALAAKRSMEIAKDLVDRLKERESILKSQWESMVKSEIETLETSVVMSEMQLNMSGFENDFQRNKEKLAVLMGLPKGSDFELVDGDFETPLAESGNIDMAKLELEALHLRPELYEQDMEENISLDDARIAVAKAMPRPSVFYRYNYDGDSHLYEDQWYEVGVRLSFDLLTVPQQLSHKREANIKTKLVKTRRQSVAAAVLTQLRLAVIDFNDANRKYSYSDVISEKRKQLVDAHKRHSEFGDDTYEVVIENEAKYLIAEVRRLQSQVDLKIAEQRILNSAGCEDKGMARFISEDQSPLVEENTVGPEPDLAAAEETPAIKEAGALAEEPVAMEDNTGEGDTDQVAEAPEAQIEPAPGKTAGEPEMEVVFNESDLTAPPVSEVPLKDSSIVEEPLDNTVGIGDEVRESVADNKSVAYIGEESTTDYEGLGKPLPFSIQLSSSRTKQEAMAKLAAYKKNGLKAYLVQINLKNKGSWWRCYEGSYATFDEASQAKADFGFKDAIVMETPYAVCLGSFTAKSDMNSLISKTISLGYSPYIIKGDAGAYQLMVGAFYSKEKTEVLVDTLTAQGLDAKGVRR